MYIKEEEKFRDESKIGDWWIDEKKLVMFLKIPTEKTISLDLFKHYDGRAYYKWNRDRNNPTIKKIYVKNVWKGELLDGNLVGEMLNVQS